MQLFLDDLLSLLRKHPELKSGYPALLGFLSRQEGVSTELIELMGELDFESDVGGLAEQLARLFESSVPDETTGMYLGLDGLNMPDGKGIEVGCSTGHRAGQEGIEFIYSCETYLEELDLPTLRQFYVWKYVDQREELSGDAGLLAEYAVALGGTALALVMALDRVSEDVLLGPAVDERLLAFGFHDGDMLRLARLRRGGMQVELAWPKW